MLFRKKNRNVSWFISSFEMLFRKNKIVIIYPKFRNVVPQKSFLGLSQVSKCCPAKKSSGHPVSRGVVKFEKAEVAS